MSSSFCYPDKAFSELTNLETLSLIGTNCKFGKGFQKLNRLKIIDFQRSCSITALSDFYFKNIRTEQDISIWLSYCPITNFTKSSFELQSHSSMLDLSSTPLTLQHNLEYIQSFAAINTLTLNYLKLDLVRQHYNLTDVLAQFEQTNITDLNIVDNRIVFTADTELFTFPSRLEIVCLDTNFIDVSPFIIALRKTPENSLKRLEMKSQGDPSLTL